MKKGMTALSGVLGFLFGGISAARLTSRSTDKWKTMSDKHLSLMLLFNQWMIVKQSGREIKEYFHKNDYKKIVVYGMSYVGERLLDDLAGSDIEVTVAIDKNAKGIFADVPVITPDENIPECDCIVVTAIYFFDEIEKVLSEKVSCPIVSLEDILYEV